MHTIGQPHRQPGCFSEQSSGIERRDPSQPPFKNGEAIHTTSDTKAVLLVNTLLQKATCMDDIPIEHSDNPEASLPFPTIITVGSYQAMFQDKSSTPGQDEISNAALRQAWPALGPHISALYKHCAATGWHPTLRHRLGRNFSGLFPSHNHQWSSMQMGPKKRTAPRQVLAGWATGTPAGSSQSIFMNFQDAAQT